ncbi:hypothetical protein O3G_MSEX012673 [Manduca sexta]|uniref:Uncharacterized protein n=1 Tax=Manduca sexta TaxID=7130 RepID=A0A922CWZ0_MANSE|nr:hypothetical protein O3G_MSEX012673 [Manduca sexta]
MGRVALNIMQWNAQSIKPKLVILEQLLHQEKIHILAVSETWLNSHTNLNIKDYCIFRRDRSDSYGGVAILIHRSFKAQICQTSNINPSLEVLVVKVFNCEYVEHVIAAYCPPHVYTSPADWDRLFSISDRKTLVLGDFNGHHSNWSTKTDSRGSLIFDSLIYHNFVTLNDGRPTRVRLVNGVLQQSAPDVTMVSSDISWRFNWQVTNECLNSDHLIIKITTSTNHAPIFTQRRNLKYANWEKYRQIIVEKIENHLMPIDLQEGYNVLIKIINEAADIAIPVVKLCHNPNSNFVPKPYWTPSLSKAVAERRLALANLRRNPTSENLTKLQEKVRISQRLIRNAKSRNWWQFCSFLNETTSASELWYRMRWLKSSNLSKPYITEDTAKNLLRNLTPDFVEPPSPNFVSLNPKLETEITLHELEKCLKSKDTAPGSDEISYSMLFNLPVVGKVTLLNLFNSFLSLSFVPVQWRNVRIIPIPKPGCEASSSIRLRPISLMSCLCKTFHNIIHKRLEGHIESNKLFAEETKGFRKARSCLDNLTDLVTQIQIGFSNKQITVACFLDVDNAYNNVDVTSLLLTLDRLNVGSKFCKYLWEFLKNRSLIINSLNYNLIRNTGRGLAQGDPLSPLLFNVATIQICKRIVSISNVNISQYADDFVIYVTSHHRNEAEYQCQIALDKLYGLFTQINLDISPNKSKICIFRKGCHRCDVKLKINNLYMEVVETVKYLGVWLDRSLRWNSHINNLTIKALKILNIFKVLAGSGWGVHPKHLRKLYIAIIRSRLDYASFLYDNSCKTNLAKLDRIQNQAMRVIGGFVRSTPIHVMESELCLCPLHVRRQYLSGKFWLKIKSMNNYSISKISTLTNLTQRAYWNNKKKPCLTLTHNVLNTKPIYSSDQIGMFSLDIWINYINISKIICIDIVGMTKSKRQLHPVSIKNITAIFLNNRYDNFHKFFTDGSLNGVEAGAAFYDLYANCHAKFKINSNSISIMEIELVAILEALSYIKSTNYSNVVILPDSKSSLQHLAQCTSNFRGRPVAYAILKLLMELQSSSKNIILQWIPSHMGLNGNEVADKLAKQAITDGIPLHIMPSFANYIPLLKKICFDSWNEYFDERSREKGIWYRTIQPHTLSSPWIDNKILNRNELVIALRLRSGHIPCNKFSYLMRKTTSPNCQTCQVIDDIYHILMECARNTSMRNDCDINILDIGHCNSLLALPLSEDTRKLYKVAAGRSGN